MIIDNPIPTLEMDINNMDQLLQDCRNIINQNLAHARAGQQAKYELYSA
jgi:hypothetical protein